MIRILENTNQPSHPDTFFFKLFKNKNKIQYSSE